MCLTLSWRSTADTLWWSRVIASWWRHSHLNTNLNATYSYSWSGQPWGPWRERKLAAYLTASVKIINLQQLVMPNKQANKRNPGIILKYLLFWVFHIKKWRLPHNASYNAPLNRIWVTTKLLYSYNTSFRMCKLSSRLMIQFYEKFVCYSFADLIQAGFTHPWFVTITKSRHLSIVFTSNQSS